MLQVDKVEVVADPGRYNSPQIPKCDWIGVAVTLPKSMTSNAKVEFRLGKQDFIYMADDDPQICPAGQRLVCRYSNVEDCKTMRR